MFLVPRLLCCVDLTIWVLRDGDACGWGLFTLVFRYGSHVYILGNRLPSMLENLLHSSFIGVRNGMTSYTGVRNPHEMAVIKEDPHEMRCNIAFCILVKLVDSVIFFLCLSRL